MATNGPSARGPPEWRALASTSLPVPVSPRIRTLLRLVATAGRSPRIRSMEALRLERPPNRNPSVRSCRNSWISERSRNVSTPPATTPEASRQTAVEMLTGTFSPSASTRNPVLPTTGLPVRSVSRKEHPGPHMLERNTSEHGRPTASARATPVISSAARLNEAIRHCASTVNTPSEMLSRMASVALRAVTAPSGISSRVESSIACPRDPDSSTIPSASTDDAYLVVFYILMQA